MIRAAFFCFLLFLSCATTMKIVPGPGAHSSVILEGMAFAETCGVSIMLETQAWTGRPDILDKITPIRITLQNKSGDLLLIRYNVFRLEGLTSGDSYAALPPYEIRGTLDDPWIILPYPLPLPSAVVCQKFSVAPYCSRMYPAFPVYQDSFTVDSLYYSRYYTVWAKIELPTEEMLIKVLPDGVIEQGGYVSGFLYFEKIDRNEEELLFTADLIDALRGRLLGTITIPLQVIRK
ncbi:MAG TPA: hypothetical protein PLE24_08305 [Chitinispirillaceae bacterium]|nr:hypothetical protein [Chitinispirillaceae bacterium]